jgi:hypothetical protein
MPADAVRFSVGTLEKRCSVTLVRRRTDFPTHMGRVRPGRQDERTLLRGWYRVAMYFDDGYSLISLSEPFQVVK